MARRLTTVLRKVRVGGLREPTGSLGALRTIRLLIRVKVLMVGVSILAPLSRKKRKIC